MQIHATSDAVKLFSPSPPPLFSSLPTPSSPPPPLLPLLISPPLPFTQSSCTVGTGVREDHFSPPSPAHSTWLSQCSWTSHRTSKRGGASSPGPPVTPPLSPLGSFELVKFCIDELQGLWHSHDHVHPPSGGAVRHFFYEVGSCSSR